jgi:hypothetical protein
LLITASHNATTNQRIPSTYPLNNEPLSQQPLLSETMKLILKVSLMERVSGAALHTLRAKLLPACTPKSAYKMLIIFQDSFVLGQKLPFAPSLSRLIDVQAKSRLVWSAAGETLAAFRQLYQIIGAHDLLLQRYNSTSCKTSSQPSLSLCLCSYALAALQKSPEGAQPSGLAPLSFIVQQYYHMQIWERTHRDQE